MIFLDKVSKKERLGLFLAAAFIIIVFMDRFIITPINTKLGRLNKESKLVEKQLSTYLRSLNQKEAVLKDYKKYAKYLQKAKSDEEETGKILAEIEELARASNLSLVDMKPQPPKTVDFYKEYIIDIEAEGEAQDIVNFMHRLSSSPQLLRTEKVRLYLKDKNSSAIQALIMITKLVIY